MVAIGCLLLVILPILGFVVGGLIAGPIGAYWGAGIGLTAACVVLFLSGYALVRIARR